MLLLLILLGIVLAYAQGGLEGVKDWFRAKLVGVTAAQGFGGEFVGHGGGGGGGGGGGPW